MKKNSTARKDLIEEVVVLSAVAIVASGAFIKGTLGIAILVCGIFIAGFYDSISASITNALTKKNKSS